MAAPRMPTPSTTACERLPGRVSRSASAMSAMMPPSPRLSARMMKITYFTATMMMSAQKKSERLPSTLARSRAMGWLPAKTSFIA